MVNRRERRIENSHPIGQTSPRLTAETTTVLLVRHGHTAAVGGRLTGRLAGVELTAEGHRQAHGLIHQLAPLAMAAIYSSPLARALETARPLAAARRLDIITCDGLIEIDFGAWTGLTMDALERLPEWQHFNVSRSRAVIPGGESAAAVQRRAVRAVETIARDHPGATVAAFTHADIIRSILVHYTGRSLDRIHDFDIAPASVTPLQIMPAGQQEFRSSGE